MIAVISKALNENRNLLEPEVWQLLEEYDLKLPPWGFAQDTATALKIAEKVGYPVVLKVVSGDIIHKSDVGGVKVNIVDTQALLNSIQEVTCLINRNMPEATIEGWMITKMLSQGVEMIIGGTRDAQFGPAVMCGMGGIFVELFKDVKMRLAPVNAEEAAEMLQELKVFELLQGYRGKEPCDIDALIELIVKVSNLLVDCPQIAELDLNPVVVLPQGTFPVDGRILLNR